MGLFNKIFQQNNSDGSGFDEKYARLKILANQIMPYEYASFDKVLLADKVLPFCNEFIDLANSIDRNKALRNFWKEAKEADPKSSYPYHPIFKACAFGNNDDWEKVVHTVEGIKGRFVRWIKGVNLFSERLNSIPSASITLLDDGVIRNKLITMPEVKYTSVGKAFNKDKLTTFVVVDTETTGLKASNGRIIELSAVKYVDWEPIEKWTTFLDPGKVEIEAEATKVNGLTNDMLVGKPTIKEVAHSFKEFVGNCAVVGYNLPFDLKFLYAEGIDLIEGKRKFYDVLELARKYYKKELDSFGLIDVASYNGLFFNAHDSLHDCLATGDLFVRIVDEITN